MNDVREAARSILTGVGYTDAYLKRFDTFTGKEAVCLLHVQPTVEQTYMDGTQIVLQPYQIIVRRRSEAEAKNVCCEIAELLEGSEVESLDGSYKFLEGCIYGEPDELDLEETNMYAWAATMAARIEVRS